jgi:hypothetical protein
VDGNSDGTATSDIGAYEIQLGPTAAGVTVSGRVLVWDGRAVSRATVTIMDPKGESQYAVTNPFGYFRFTDVSAGATYVVTVKHKIYTFGPKIISVNEDLTDLTFTAQNPDQPGLLRQYNKSTDLYFNSKTLDQR